MFQSREPFLKVTNNDILLSMTKELEDNYIAFQKIQNELIKVEKTFSIENNNFSKNEFSHFQSQIEEEFEKFKEEKEAYFENKNKIISHPLSQNNQEFTQKFDVISGKTEEKIKQIEKLREHLNALQNKYLQEHELIDSKVSSLISDNLDDQMFKNEIIDEEEFLKKRRKDLEEIKVVSGNLKEMTKGMATTVEEQRNNLNKIEENINVVQSNVTKGKEEIEAAKKENKKNSHKTWLLVAVILIIILGIAAIFLALKFL